MKFVDADTVHRLLDYPGLVEALRAAHTGPAPQSDASVMDEPTGGENKFVSLVSWATQEVIAVKHVGVFSLQFGAATSAAFCPRLRLLDRNHFGSGGGRIMLRSGYHPFRPSVS